MRLLKTLQQLKKEERVSFHMPGHKTGRMLFKNEMELLSYDITEIPGADNLHDAKGCILETEQAISNFYGSKYSKMLVGGSTVGILSVILGSTRPGDGILVNRNSHKSVYNAIEMNNLVPTYLFPEIDEFLGIPISLDVEKIDIMVKGVKICVLTYPTYEGLCYPIEEIIESCKRHHVPVLVDEAHGAHLILNPDGPKSSLALGADIVVQSFHKTMPAMTQTACIHFSKQNTLSQNQEDRILWYLSSLQTSSPSYVLMASIDNMLEIVEECGQSKMKILMQALESFHQRIDGLKTIKAHRFDLMDLTKIILYIPSEYYNNGIWDGKVLSQKLLEDYKIQAEYDSKSIVLMMTSICTSSEDLERLASALLKLDFENETIIEGQLSSRQILNYKNIYDHISDVDTYVYSAYAVVDFDKIEVDIAASVGCISAAYVIPYPPGIPILVPGERIKRSTIELFPDDLKRIQIVNEGKINEVRGGQ